MGKYSLTMKTNWISSNYITVDCFNGVDVEPFARFTCHPSDKDSFGYRVFSEFLLSKLAHVSSLLDKVETACWEVIA